MEMDWGTAIIGTVSILICVVPIIRIYHRNRKKEQMMMQILLQMAHENCGQICQYEFCGDFAIGFDHNRKYVFLVKKNKTDLISHFIELREIQSVKVNRKNREHQPESSGISSIEKIELLFVPSSKNRGEISFGLYDITTHHSLSGELQFAEKWAKILNGHLRN